MTTVLLIYHITAFLCLGVTVYAVSHWGRPRALFFICYAFAITVYAVGYLLEITAPTLDAAMVACKIQYFGIPYIAPFYFLFTRDYSGARIRKRSRIVALLAFPILCTLLVCMWPATRWFYQDVAFSTQGAVNHLVITPGWLYHAALVYNMVVMLVGFIFIVRYYLKGGALMRRHLLVFLLASVLPFAGWALRFAGLSWDANVITLTLNVAILAAYMIRYRQRGWAVAAGREMAIQHMKDAFIMLDSNGCFLDANTAGYAYFPTLGNLAVGASMSLVENFPPQLSDGCYADVEFTLEVNGEVCYMRASRSQLDLVDNTVGTSILIYDDSENHHLMEELQQLAIHDTLTGLYNRGTFFQYASRDFDLARRKHNDGSILMMDIDHFKQVNDVHGHQAGDKVLIAIADILRARLRHTDIAGRYGGEELAVWLPDAPAEGAAIIADVIRRALEHTNFESDKGRFHVTVSIGVAGLDHTRDSSFENLVSEADSALYQAKREGRNRVCIHRPHQSGEKS